ncbi:MAG: hypothetical protein AAGP08_01580 [Pseudomonadota bacterium]
MPYVFLCLCVGLCCLGLMTQGADAGIVSADYNEVAEEADGRVDFEAMPAAPFPGITLTGRLRFPGLAIGPKFVGQVHFLRGVAEFATLGLSGRPDIPFRVSQRPDWRAIVEIEQAGRVNHALIASASTASVDGTKLVRNWGGGALVFRFSDRQRRLGFRVLSSPSGAPTTPQLVVRFFAADGAWITAPTQILIGPGLYAYATESEDFIIQGFSLEPINGSRFAIDDIVFDAPLLLGNVHVAPHRAHP